MAITFSIIIPVYNRPEEIRELLGSIKHQRCGTDLEVVIIEDGSTETCGHIVEEFQNSLDITYLQKPNTGPGDSRNYGMRHARNNYFIILDSDCILSEQYLQHVYKELKHSYVACFGGPDAAHESFTEIQKAIDYSMTSLLTTGGIRGNKRALSTFEPRSFNMGLSKEAFEAVGGFANLHPGEDPDLVWRVRKAGFKTRFMPRAVVYHKRRIDFKKFFRQVHKFGMVRPILNRWHPESARITHWFPTFLISLPLVAVVLAALGLFKWSGLILGSLILYFLAILIGAILKSGNAKVALLAVFAAIVQFYGYGTGYLKSVFKLTFSRKKPRDLFPELFF